MISVVIPVYNAKKYFPECLDSLKSQSVKNFEIVLVDDGSSDGSSELCDRFKKDNHDLNVQVIHQENCGQLLAHRVGMKAAHGDYLVFLDADDALRSDSISIIQEIIANQAPDIIAFNYCRDDTVNYEKNSSQIKNLNPGCYEDCSYGFIKQITSGGEFNNLATKAVRKSLIDLNTDYTKWASLMHGEDYIQVLPIIDSSNNLVYINEVLYFYRENPESSTRSFKESQIQDLETVFNQVFLYAKKWGNECNTKAKEAVCRHLLWILYNLSRSANTSKYKVAIASTLADQMKRFCGSEIFVITNKLRIEMSCIARCLLSGHYRLAIALAGTIDRLYKYLF